MRFMISKIILYAGGFSCLRKAIEIDNVILCWGLDNLNSCKENETSVEILIE